MTHRRGVKAVFINFTKWCCVNPHRGHAADTVVRSVSLLILCNVAGEKRKQYMTLIGLSLKVKMRCQDMMFRASRRSACGPVMPCALAAVCHLYKSGLALARPSPRSRRCKAGLPFTQPHVYHLCR